MFKSIDKNATCNGKISSLYSSIYTFGDSADVRLIEKVRYNVLDNLCSKCTLGISYLFYGYLFLEFNRKTFIRRQGLNFQFKYYFLSQSDIFNVFPSELGMHKHSNKWQGRQRKGNKLVKSMETN
jgi:hypothetical protein